MNQNLIDKLLLDLKSSDLNIRERATSQLWRIWFWEKGTIPLALIEESERLLSEGDVTAASSESTTTKETTFAIFAKGFLDKLIRIKG